MKNTLSKRTLLFMDSLTQVALGGAVGYAVLGSKIGRKAIVWGTILGTLPDLDVFLPYAGEVEAFTYHRGFSHSLLVHILASPLIVWLILKLHPLTRPHKKRWFWLVLLSLSTHAILDTFTVYGTQLLWPVTEHPFAVSNLFIIDPLYTLPLLFGLAVATMPKVSRNTAVRLNTLGLVISTVYIVWSLAAKVLIDNKVDAALIQQNIIIGDYISTPAPLTTLLWRVVATSQNQYYEAYVSVLDSSEDITFTAFATKPELLKGIDEDWEIKRLQWFTKGFYGVKQQGSTVFISDLRMGIECSYVFNFAVGEINTQTTIAGTYAKISERPDMSSLDDIWHRIWNPAIVLSPSRSDEKCLSIEE